MQLMSTIANNLSSQVIDIKRKKLKVAHNSNDIIVALPPEIAELILQMLDIVDYHRFSAVCKTWRSIAVAAKQKQHFSLQQLPWLMLSSNNSSEDDDHGFFSPAHGKILKLKLPKVRGCRCCGSSWGWLIMANDIGDNFLLNPLSRLNIQLPSQTTLSRFCSPIHDLERWFQGASYIRKAMLLTPPSISSTASTTSCNGVDYVASNCIVVAIYEVRNLGFCRPGDHAWTRFSTGNVEFHFQDMILFKDQLYAVTDDYNLVLIELDPHPKGTKVDMPCPESHDRMLKLQADVELIYLVESCGELLMVVRHCNFPRRNGNVRLRTFNPYITTTFKVFKLRSRGWWRWIEVDSLGDQMLFVGTNGGISLSASLFSGFRGNCIYFTDDNYWSVLLTYDGPGAACDLGMFNLDDGSIKSFLPTDSHSSVSPPVWYMPSLL
ncbi:uncharacterized protein At1g65760-like [Cornus florida]|uniref:uncharacterized protein At1g65760-like n=1 Tax=Cornus florida TaxID=4283 RepID=UPI00289E6BB2|nr:uncharacterized protein At1g65760-like [Cornus florida]